MRECLEIGRLRSPLGRRSLWGVGLHVAGQRRSPTSTRRGGGWTFWPGHPTHSRKRGLPGL